MFSYLLHPFKGVSSTTLQGPNTVITNPKYQILTNYHIYHLHQGKSRWHSCHVLVYISPVLTYLLGTVPCTLTMGYQLLTTYHEAPPSHLRLHFQFLKRHVSLFLHQREILPKMKLHKLLDHFSSYSPEFT